VKSILSVLFALLLLPSGIGEAAGPSEILGAFKLRGGGRGGPYTGTLELEKGGLFAALRRRADGSQVKLVGSARWRGGRLELTLSSGIVGRLADRVGRTQRFTRLGESWEWREGAEFERLTAFRPADRLSKLVVGARERALQTIPVDDSDLGWNRRITAAYAEIYLEDPGAFAWAGLAAHASDFTGVWIKALKRLERFPFQRRIARAFGLPSLEQFRDYLATANQVIYKEFLWQYRAYLDGGLPAMERGVALGLVAPDLLPSWQLLDQGRARRKAGDLVAAQALFDRGHDHFLGFEQSLLQRVLYGPNQEGFQRASSLWLVRKLFPIKVNIPGSKSFHDVLGKKGDLSSLEQRLRWVQGELHPALKRWVKEDPEALKKDMRRMIAAGGATRRRPDWTPLSPSPERRSPALHGSGR